MWSSLSDNMLDADVGATPVTKYSSHFPSRTRNTITHPPFINRDHINFDGLGCGCDSFLVFWRPASQKQQLVHHENPIRDEGTGAGGQSRLDGQLTLPCGNSEVTPASVRGGESNYFDSRLLSYRSRGSLVTLRKITHFPVSDSLATSEVGIRDRALPGGR